MKIGYKKKKKTLINHTFKNTPVTEERYHFHAEFHAEIHTNMSDRVDIIFNNSRLICAIEICTFFSTKGGHNAKEFFGNNTSKRSQNNMTHAYISQIFQT